MPPTSERGAAWRDRLAWRICNFTLRHIATRRYSAFLEGSIRYGLFSAARDEIEAKRA